jgi:hypothetical protein
LQQRPTRTHTIVATIFDNTKQNANCSLNGSGKSKFDCRYKRRSLMQRQCRIQIMHHGGQATKGVWWMSRRQEAMKGVEDCEKPGEAVKQALIPGSLNYRTLNT